MRWLLSLVLVLCPAVASAQITRVAAQANSSPGTTSVNVTWPTVAAGQLAVLCVANRFAANALTLSGTGSTGWSIPSNAQLSAGSGAAGPDSGDIQATVYVKETVGDEDAGTLTVNAATGNFTIASLAVYTKTAGTWGYAATNGSDTDVTGTGWSVTGGADPGVAGLDWLIACTAVNSDGFTFSNHAFLQTGITWSAANATEQADISGNNGDDGRLVYADLSASSGTSSSAPTYTATHTAASGNAPAGPTIMLRIREVTAAGGCTGGLLLLGVGKC
jgi:hypothetical protein